MLWGIFFSSLCSACTKMQTRYKELLFIPFPYIPLLLLTPDLSASRPVNTTEQKCPLYSPFAWSVVTSPLHSTVLWLEILEIKRDFTCIHTALEDIDTSLSLTVQIWSCVGQVLALSKHKVKEKNRIKRGGVKRKYKIIKQTQKRVCTRESLPSCPSDHCALFLPKVRVRWLVVGCDHVGRVPPSHRSRRALHHHQPDGRLCRLRIRGVLLRGIFAPAVVHNTWYQEDQEQDNIAGNEDAKVQSDGVDLLVVLQKAHGAVFMLGGAEALEEKCLGGLRAMRRRMCRDIPNDPLCPLRSVVLAPPALHSCCLAPASRFQTSAADTWLCGKNTLIRAAAPPAPSLCNRWLPLIT